MSNEAPGRKTLRRSVHTSEPQVVAVGWHKEVTRFLFSGGSATLIHWGVMAALIGIGLNPIAATAIGALAGSIANYAFQFFWTFNAASSHRAAIPAYATVVILGWAINAGLYYVLISCITIGLALSQLCATAVVTVINFILYKKVVFHERVD